MRKVSEYHKIEAEFKSKIKALQESCPHPELSDWMEYGNWRSSAEWWVKCCKRCGKEVTFRHRCDWCGKCIELSHWTARDVYCSSKGMQGSDPPYEIAINWVICSVECCREKRLIVGIIDHWDTEVRRTTTHRPWYSDRRRVGRIDTHITAEAVIKILHNHPGLQELVARIGRKTSLARLVG